MANLKQFIQRLAKHSYKKHLFIQEWQTFILISIILKLAAMSFSIFAGYYYFNQLFISILNSALGSMLFSVIVLLIVEVLTAISLSKFFKFALRLELKTAIPILLLSIFFFSISFISSTNGLALRQSKKVDITELLTNQYNTKILNTNLLYDDKAEQIKERINTIKINPQGWTKGKRTILLSDQLKQIDKYYNDLQKSESSRKQELNRLKSINQNDLQLNNNHQDQESKKYYNIVAFLMLIIFLINALLMFFYSRVFNENEKELATIEVINTFSTDINNKATNLIENQIADTFNLYFSAIQNDFQTKVDDSGANNKSIGFNMNKETINNNDINNNINEIENKQPYARNTGVNAHKNNKTHGKANCKYCNNVFTKQSYNQIYCTEEHRILQYGKTNNKNVDRYIELAKGKKK